MTRRTVLAQNKLVIQNDVLTFINDAVIVNLLTTVA